MMFLACGNIAAGEVKFITPTFFLIANK